MIANVSLELYPLIICQIVLQLPFDHESVSDKWFVIEVSFYSEGEFELGA